MRLAFGALPWELLGRRPAMITLTYPRDWRAYGGTAEQVRRHREAFKERWRRKWGPPIGVWVVEFQRRGAPHLHMYLGLPDVVSDEEYMALQRRTIRRRRMTDEIGTYEARRQMKALDGPFGLWLRTAWSEIVGSGSPAHHVRGVDVAVQFWSDQAAATANRVRVAEYMWRESGKWAQKQPPEGFGSLRFWGRWGEKHGFKPVFEVEKISDRAFYDLRRLMRRWRLDKERLQAAERGYRFRPGQGPRGRDGLTVFGVDGTRWRPRLVEWAESVAIAKAATAEEVVLTRLPRGPFHRAFSELETPDPDDPEVMYEQWLAKQCEDEEARLEDREAHLEAMIDAYLNGEL